MKIDPRKAEEEEKWIEKANQQQGTMEKITKIAVQRIKDLPHSWKRETRGRTITYETTPNCGECGHSQSLERVPSGPVASLLPIAPHRSSDIHLRPRCH